MPDACFADSDLTDDRFLDGRLRLYQPRAGYRAGVDPVFLAASVPIRPGQSLLDLGCGVGAAALCVGARFPGVELAGLELQSEYADLARRNGVRNGIAFDVQRGDLLRMPMELKARQFNHVIMNPPYYDRARGTAARDSGRDTSLGGETPLREWVVAASKRLAPKGYLSVVQRADRLADLLAPISELLGSVQVLPLLPREGRDASLILVRARKDGRAALRLHAGVVLHEGEAHSGDRESYVPDIAAVLRDGAAFPFPD